MDASSTLPSEPDPPPNTLSALCAFGLDALKVDGVSIVISVRKIPQKIVASAGSLGSSLPDLEFAIGEGPSFDCAQTGSPIEVVDLGSVDNTKWPLFSEKALGVGVHSLLVFPLERGAVQLGALAFYSTNPRTMSGDDFRQGLALADRVTTVLIGLPMEVIESAEAVNWMSPDSDRIRIHQASGMVAYMLGSTVEEALDRMRAFSYSNELSLLKVADLIISKELTFNP